MSTGGVICLFIDLGWVRAPTARMAYSKVFAFVAKFVAINKGILYKTQIIICRHYRYYYETNAQVCCNCFG